MDAIKRLQRRKSPAHIAGAFAAVLGASSPSVADPSMAIDSLGGNVITTEAQARQSGIEDLSDQDRVLALTIHAEAKTLLEEKISIYNAVPGLDKEVEKYSNLLQDLTKYVHDDNYLHGLISLKKLNVDVVSFMIKFGPENIKSPAHIKQKLSIIPRELLGKFEVTRVDLESNKYYGIDGFADVATELSSRGIFLKSYYIATIINLNKNNAQFYDALKYLQDGGIKLSSFIIRSLKGDWIGDKTFLDALITLNSNGINLNYLLSASDENGITPEKAQSVKYIDAVIKLKKAGVSEFSMRDDLSLEYAENDLFIDNFLLLRKFNLISEYDLYIVDFQILTNEYFSKRFRQLQKLGNAKLLSRLVYSGDRSMTIEKLESDAYFSGIEYLITNGIKLSPYDLRFFSIAHASDKKYLEYVLQSRKESGEVNFTEASKLYARNELGGVFEAIRNGNILEYQRVKGNNSISQITKDYLTKYEEYIYTDFVLNMNRENEPNGVRATYETRLADLNGLNTQTKFKIIAEYGAHGWTSTQNLLYDGYHIDDFENFDEMNEEAQKEVLEKHKYHLPLYFDIKKNYGNAYNFIMQVKPTPKQINSFIAILADMGKVESFFKLIGTVEQQNEIVDKFLLGIENSSDKIGKMTGIVELLISPDLGASKAFVIRGIEARISKLERELADNSVSDAESRKDALILYRLILVSYYQRLSSIGDNEQMYEQVRAELSTMSHIARRATEMYGEMLPLFEKIPEDKLFTNGVHLQYNLFFNNLPDQNDNSIKDRDGHNSLLKTIEYYGGHIEYTDDGEIKKVSDGSKARRNRRHFELRSVNVDGKEMKYVIMSQTKGKRSVVIIMNSPKLLNKEVIAFYKHIQENPVVKGIDGTLVQDVHGFRLRGHGISSITDTGVVVFKNMRTFVKHDIPLASYGSCGGNKYGFEITKISPSSLYSGFMSTGMAFVTLNLQRGEIDFMLEHGYYDTRELKRGADERFKHYSDRMRSGYKSFRWAHQNIPQKVYVAFNKIKAKEKK